MPLIQLELFSAEDLLSCFGKTYPASSAPKTTPSAASWQNLLARTFPYSPAQKDGRVVVMLPDPSDVQHGGSSTLNTSESPNDAVGCSLSLLLERTLPPPQILFERPRVRGDFAQSGSEGEETSRPALERAPCSIFDITHTEDVVRESAISPTLCSRMGTGGNQVPILLSENGTDRTVTKGISPPVKTSTPIYFLAENTIGRQPQNGGNGTGYSEDVSYTLNASGVHGVCKGKIVRKLTPRECERLQGFPDDWTKVPYRGKSAEECPDAPRYKAIGNSWAVPCAEWIGKRIIENL